MMEYWKTQYEAGEFSEAASVFASDAVLTVSGKSYTGASEIISWLTHMYSISQTVTVVSSNVPNENNQVIQCIL